MRRRTLLAGLGAPGIATLSAAGAAAGPRLGVDLFSLRGQGWDAFQFLDYCSKWGAQVVHFSEIRFLGSLEDDHVRKVGAHASNLGIELEIGMRSICPTSTLFDPKQGTAEEQVARVIRAATLAKSKIVRAFLGSAADRKTGIEQHIENAVKTLRNVRSRAADAGIRIAIENHAGDMQARELKTLVEGAGTDVVGVCLDSGNPCWTLEDPHLTLETLAPYVLTSHIRDSYLWNTPEGTMVRWVRMGEGNVDIGRFLRRFMELCPGKAMSLEVIVTGARPYAWRKPEFWQQGYQSVRAAEFVRFLAIADTGKPQQPAPPVPKERAAEVEREDLEASAKWTREFLKV
ncbi:MAG: sugar phosphate isomerase/epimerase [Bryobacterales bacterium]|nr:sugar phosphate isomerase/epimerase [Bryobacterales bacterium]